MRRGGNELRALGPATAAAVIALFVALTLGTSSSTRSGVPAYVGSTASAPIESDEHEALEFTMGGEALRFRHMQHVDDNGKIPDNALLDAAAHRDQMRGRRPAGFGPAVAGISPGSWEWLGPGNIGGRVRSILIHPTQPDTMWSGSVTGGIFKTTNGGASWTHLDDFMANLAVGSLVAHPTTPDTIYAATGEYVAGNLDQGIRGAGVFKSTNGGTSWSQLASTANSNWWYTNRLAVHPTTATTLLAATWAGVFRSTNGGTSWTNEYNLGEVQDIDYDPSNGSNAIAGGWGGRALFSTNGGDTWTEATGLPALGFPYNGRVEVAYAPSNPAITYASVDVNGGAIYKSMDGGQSYAFAGPTPTDVDYLGAQGWYDSALWVDPTNAAHIIVGGIDLYRSTNSGASLTKISDWVTNANWVRSGGVGPLSAHADHHAIVAHPSYNGTSNTTVFFGNDGGIHKTSNVTTVSQTSGWQELNNNLGITQFYGAGGNVTSGKIFGGTQDNGTLRYNGATETWTMTEGGDGGFTFADQTDPNYMYGEYVYGSVYRSSNGGNSVQDISGVTNFFTWECAKASQYEIADVCNQTANFIAPFALDSNNAHRLLVGGMSLWRTNDARAPWTVSTGPTWAAVKPSVGSPISAIAIDDGNPDLVYVGHNNGLIYRSTNATQAIPTWTRVDLDAMPARMVLGLTIDPANPNVVYAMFGGFTADNVYQLTDGNMGWIDRTGSGFTGLPNVPARSLVVNPTNSNWLYLGTELGVFASEDGGATWNIPGDGPANVPVDQLFMLGDELVAATYGRGLFRTEITVEGLPGAPTGVSAVPGNAQATVSWSAPADDGGSPITNYVVTPFIGAVAQSSTQVGNVLTTPITGLTNGTTYTFKVAAVNANGTGPPSAASNAVTPRTVPGAPTGVTATAGDEQVSVLWTAPASNGGAAITNYVVTPYVGAVAQSSTQVGNVTGTVIGGLTNGTTYTFKVAAVNAAGTGPDSAASNAVTPQNAPTNASPFSVAILNGSLGSGSVASLATANDDYLAVNSSTGKAKIAAFYGVFTGVPDSLSSLTVTYQGKSSRTCVQAIRIRDFEDNVWRTLDLRSVGTSDVDIANLVPSGTLADHVEGASGNGEVWVQVTCQRRGARLTHVARGDFLRITHS